MSKVYLGLVKNEEITGLEEYEELSEEEIAKIKDGKLGFIDILDEEDKFDNEELYYHLFTLIRNEDNEFVSTEAQKEVIVASCDYDSDACKCLLIGNEFVETEDSYLQEEDDSIVYKCGNSVNGKELVYKYEF